MGEPLASSPGFSSSDGSSIYTMKTNIVKGTYPQLVAYLTLQVWTSHLGLPGLLAIIFFAKRVKRHPTLINLYIAFIVIGLSTSLLLYARATTGPEPAPILCLLQASLLYGMPTLTSSAAFMLVWQMFLRVRTAHYCKPYRDDDHVIRVWSMLITPWILYFIPVTVTAAVGAGQPDRVSRNRRFFYCSLDCLPLTNAIAIASSLILFATVFFIIWSIILLLRHRKVMREEGSRLRASIDLSLPIRIMLFGLYVIVAMSLSLLSVTSPSTPVPDMVIACAGTVVILIFGTQRDMLETLCFWKNGRRVIQVETDVSTPDLRTAFDESVEKRQRGL